MELSAFLFPGQGSQKVGMGRALHGENARVAELFERANAVLGYDLASLCFEGPEDKLTNTLYAQPALLTVDVAAFYAAQERGLEASMTAGHSLGEYAALVAAGALEFEDALRLVNRRAELMSEAPSGTMAALIGLADEAVPQVLGTASAEGLVVAANWNSPGQVVVSGDEKGVEAAMRVAKENGAKMAVPLPVSGAFHSPLMREAGEEMSTLIANAPFADAKIPVYQNTTAKPGTSADELKAALQGQMTGAVRWTETIRAMIEGGATQFYELGPGKVLAGLNKRIDKSVAVEAFDA